MEQNALVIETIKENYQQMFAAEKKVADYILAYPEQVVSASVSELAELSGVRDATVIRMCKHLGYQGFYQMKINLARYMRWRWAIRARWPSTWDFGWDVSGSGPAAHWSRSIF